MNNTPYTPNTAYSSNTPYRPGVPNQTAYRPNSTYRPSAPQPPKKKSCLGSLLKWTLFLVIAIVVCVAVANLGDGDSGAKSDIEGTVNLNSEPLADGEDYLYYSVMTRKEQHIYDQLLAAVRAGKTTCRVTNIDVEITEDDDLWIDTFNHAVVGLTYDHPELFWVQGSWESQIVSQNGDTVDMDVILECFAYWEYTMDPAKYTTALEREVKAVARKAEAAASTDFEKAKFVHDYLISTAYYDFDGLAESEKTRHDPSCEYIYSAYGCLVNKKTVCAGYAAAFQLIMNEMGIPCTVVAGDSLSGEYHGWNRVKLDGESYYVDVTWDDHDYTDDAGRFIYTDEAIYEYFGLTTEELERDHIIEVKYFEDSPCNGEENNYYVKNDYQLDTYSLEEVAEIIDRQADKDFATVRFTNKRAYEKAKADLLDNKQLWAIPSLDKLGELAGIRPNDTQYTLTFVK